MIIDSLPSAAPIFPEVRKKLSASRNNQRFLNLRSSIFEAQEELGKWEIFYQQFLGMDVDVSEAAVPAEEADFSRVLILPAGIFTLAFRNAIVAKLSSLLPVEDNLSLECFGPSENNDSAYAVRIKDEEEADFEISSFKTKASKKKGRTIILEERIVWHLMLILEGSKLRPDRKGFTLCLGQTGKNMGDSVGFIDGVLHLNSTFIDGGNSVKIFSREALTV